MNLRCKDCRFWAKRTISVSGCYKKGTKKHALSGTCKDFEPKPQSTKQEYKLKRITEVF